MQELIKTPLYNLHLELDAKMVPFAGYKMPVQYTSGIIQEHLHCRKHVGFFDISHMGQCIITGKTSAQELEKLTPGNISGLKSGQQRYTVLTNKNGGIIDDIIITRTESGFFIIVNAACKEKDFTHLKQHLSEHCEVKVLQDQALFAIQGPASAIIMAQLSAPASELSFMQTCTTQISDMPCFISRCGYTGEDGFEISIANQYAESLAKQLLAFDQVEAIGLGARDTLRLEAGLCLYGHELSETISPVEAGLKWTFRKDVDNFLGADTIQSQLKQGATNKRVGLLIEGKIPIRSGSDLFDSQNIKIGLVTSGSFSPSMNKPIALALIDSGYKEQVLYATVRSRTIIANISSLPFIPHRYHRS
ncbi:MAG: glycine cleavage system aminomethyltransferase GcvT [Methylococcaceae bacterium]|nr:glycine cleavage system aminomethyltransferase GcvT [Methylococcaceae bacterium]